MYTYTNIYNNTLLLLLLLYTRLRGSLVAAKALQKTKIEGEHLVWTVWTVGNGDPMHGVCIPHSIPRAWEQQG